VSWLAPVLTRLRDLGDYEAALLMKAKIEACLAAVVSDEGDETLTGSAAGLLKDAQGRTVEAFEPGMILYRRGVGSVEVVNPSGGGSHAAFARRALEAAAVGAGLTYDQVSGDLTQANYSSLRAGKIEFRRLCEQVQYGMLIPMLVRPVAERFHAQGALLGLWGGDMPDAVSHVPPAHRNRNPGNIEHVPANKWQGLAEPPSDGRFCRFTSHEFGIRALAALLVTYQDRHKLRTPRAIITRWAPQVENDTAAYIAVVARRIGVGPDDAIDLHRHDHLRPLVEAIIHHECARLAYAFRTARG
jgi:hypothetical protein